MQQQRSNIRFIFISCTFIFLVMFILCCLKILLLLLKAVICCILKNFVFMYFSLHIVWSHYFCYCLGCSKEFWMLNMWYPIKIHFGNVFSLTDLEPLVNLALSHLAFQPSHFLILATKGESGFPPLDQPAQSQKWLLPCELLVKASKHYSRRKSTAFTQYLLWSGSKAYCNNVTLNNLIQVYECRLSDMYVFEHTELQDYTLL